MEEKKDLAFIRVINKIEDVFLVGMSAFLLFMLFTNIVMREVFSSGLVWADEVSRWGAIWIYWIGVSLCERRGETIKIEIITDRLNEKNRVIIEIIGNLIVIIFAIVLVKLGIEKCISSMEIGRSSPILGLPIYLYYGAMPIGCTLMIIRFLYKLPSQIRFVLNKEANI